jgi:hypothetical protein
MGNIKGSTVNFIRQEIEKLGGVAMDKLMFALTPEVQTVFKKTLPIQWVPIEHFAAIVKAASPVLYPGDSLAQQKLGQAMAKDNLSGIYKVLMRFTSVPYLAEQSSKLWSTYHQQGKARSEQLTANAANFILEDYPTAPPVFLDFLTGYVYATLSFAPVKNIKIVLDTSNSSAWKYQVTWD